MPPKNQLIEAFRALCTREGGVELVADEIGASAEGLRQVFNGIKLPSGRPRGLGPTIQAKLEARYPGWWGVNVDPAPRERPSLAEALPVVLDALAVMVSSRWVSVRAQFDQVVGRPEMRDDVLAELNVLMSAQAKRPAQSA